jgi:hypothetical protein
MEGSVPPPAVTAPRPDIMPTTTTARPTPKPARVSFGEVLAAGAGVAVNGAQTVLSALPGSPVSAPGIRQAGGTGISPASAVVAEGPTSTVGITPGIGGIGLGTGTGLGTTTGIGGTGLTGTGSTDPSSSMSAALQQSAELSMQYLQLQQEEDAQQRQYEALSNIEKTRHDSAHNAIGNIGQ